MTFPTNLNLHFDGACEERNPGGISTFGYVITAPDGSVFAQNKGVVSKGGPLSTNNRAEYTALGMGLRHLVCLEWTGTLEIRGDSKLVIYQIKDLWECRATHLIKLRDRCWELLHHFAGWSASWLPREENEAADKLSQEAWEEFTGKKFPVRRRKQKA